MTTNWVDLLNHIAGGRDLTSDEVSAAMHSIMSGEASPAKIASFIYGIRVKGSTPTELEAAASTMLDFAQPVKLPSTPRMIVGLLSTLSVPAGMEPTRSTFRRWRRF